MGMSYAEALSALTGPGAPFEMVEEEVRGVRVRNFRNRERSLREKIANAALRGEQEFLVQGGRRISYGAFARQVWGTAEALERRFGLKRGERLAVLAYNSPDWLIPLFAATSLGGIGVGLNGWWAEEELAYALEDSGSRFLVVDERLYPRVEPILRRRAGPEHVFFIGERPPEGTIPVGRILEESDRMPEVPIDEDDPFVLLYTSGTTGRSKACITTHRGTITQVLGIAFGAVAQSLVSGTPGALSGGAQTSLLTSPLFHVAGLHSSFCTALTSGARVVLPEGRFDPEEIMRLIERERVTLWGAIPTMLHRVVHHERVGDYDLSSLRAITFGGAPTAPETIDRAREVLPVEPSLGNAYGLTETHGVATLNTGADLLRRKTAAGRPLPVLDLRIAREDGSPADPGELGEIRFRGPTVTPGYWNRPDATAETVVDGWLHTGDIGFVDAEGFLTVVDRAKDMILRGGENVYCVEIENCLAEHPEVDEAAVVGIPDPELGERVAAAVRPVPGRRPDPAALQRHVGAHLAAFKVPEKILFVDDPLPRNPAGKLLKRQIAEWFA